MYSVVYTTTSFSLLFLLFSTEKRVSSHQPHNFFLPHFIRFFCHRGFSNFFSTRLLSSFPAWHNVCNRCSLYWPLRNTSTSHLGGRPEMHPLSDNLSAPTTSRHCSTPLPGFNFLLLSRVWGSELAAQDFEQLR